MFSLKQQLQLLQSENKWFTVRNIIRTAHDASHRLPESRRLLAQTLERIPVQEDSPSLEESSNAAASTKPRYLVSMEPFDASILTFECERLPRTEAEAEAEAETPKPSPTPAPVLMSIPVPIVSPTPIPLPTATPELLEIKQEDEEPPAARPNPFDSP
jgi:hypothetical protein